MFDKSRGRYVLKTDSTNKHAHEYSTWGCHSAYLEW